MTLEIGTEAPDFTLVGSDGEDVTLSSFRGTPVYLNFHPLALSLHAADDATRDRLMPINTRWPIANVLAQCRRYGDRTGRRVFIEYLMLEEVNDSVADAKRLADLLRDGRFHINLIEYNATGGPYTGSSPDRVRRFREELERAGFYPSLRRSRGADIAAACGQLANTTA